MMRPILIDSNLVELKFYQLQNTKQKRIDALTNKMKNNEFIKVKNRMCYYYLTSL